MVAAAAAAHSLMLATANERYFRDANMARIKPKTDGFRVRLRLCDAGIAAMDDPTSRAASTLVYVW